MHTEIGHELARLVKARVEAARKAAEDEENRIWLDENQRKAHIDLLTSALEPILAGFNTSTERALRLTLSKKKEYLAVLRSSEVIVKLKICATDLSYQGPIQNEKIFLRYRFLIDTSKPGETIFYAENAPANRMDATSFVSMILKHALGLLT